MRTPTALALVAGSLLVGAAVGTELSKPPRKRTWTGSIGGVVPYDFRPPTLARLRSRFWNRRTDRVFTPHVFGVGWSVNFARLVELVQDA